MLELSKKDKVIISATIYDNPYIPHDPTPKQIQALINPARELFYGGAAGGGKSDFLLMCALQWVEIPGYSAIIFRKTYSDLSKPGALIPRAAEWLSATDARWSGSDKKWIFPSGAVLVFGHMDHENQKYNYQGGDYVFIGFDELTHFSESQYRYLFSRLRRSFDAIVPSRVRGTCNPDGVGFEWVKSRFVDPGDPSRPFIASRLDDNPFLDTDDYEKSLDALDPITKAKLRDGDWAIRAEGLFFKNSKITVLDKLPPQVINCVRFWDLAATPEPEAGSSDDPDYTVGLKLAINDGICYIIDVKRGRWSSERVDSTIMATAEADGLGTVIFCEEEPGSSGKRNTDYLRRLLKGYAFSGVRATGEKVVRARPVASWVNQGKVVLIRGAWNNDFIDELSIFPQGNHDDQVDCFSGAFQQCQTNIYQAPIVFDGGIADRYDAEVF